MKKILIIIGLGLVVLLAAAGIILYPSLKVMLHTEIIQLDPTLTVVQGGGGNSGIIVGDSAVIIIDTKMMGKSEDLFKLAKEKAGKKPLIVVNTHFHRDHVSGNKYYKGSPIYIGNYEKSFLEKNVDPENQPNQFVKDSCAINIGGDEVLLYDLGRAHTTHDLVVYLPKHGVLFTGDLVSNRINPVLKDESSANVTLWIGVLDTIVSRWSSSRIIPGHGNYGDKGIVLAMRQYFLDLTEAAKDPTKANQLTKKYSDWLTMPSMSSPEKTVEYIKSHL